MASGTPENTPDLVESRTTRREHLTPALFEILGGDDRAREGTSNPILLPNSVHCEVRLCGTYAPPSSP